MRLANTINAWILRRLRPRFSIECVGDEIVAGDERLSLHALQQAVAYQEALYVGQRLALALMFQDGRRLAISQEDPCWNVVLDALDRLRLTEPLSPEWSLRLLAGEQSLVLRSGD